jgi:hypothetical protein
MRQGFSTADRFNGFVSMNTIRKWVSRTTIGDPITGSPIRHSGGLLIRNELQPRTWVLT